MAWAVPWGRQQWCGKGYCVMLTSVKNEPVEGQFRLHPLQQFERQLHTWKNQKALFRVLCGMSVTTYLAKPALYTILILKGPQSTIPCERQTMWMKTLVVCGLSEAGNQIAAWHWALWLPQGVFKEEKRKQKGAAIVQGLLSSENQNIFKYSFQSLALHLICVLQK